MIAEHFSDYMAPTFDGRYDIVYALILVGFEPSSSRESIETVRSFAALATARRTTSGDPGVEHCIEEERDGTVMCVDTMKFVAIHFDSFRAQFCAASTPPSDCPATPDVFSECWCANPRTVAVEFVQSMEPVTESARAHSYILITE